MLDDAFDLGAVTAPSGVLVLGMAAWTDYGLKDGDSLSARAKSAGAAGVHLQNGGSEAIAVRAAAGPLPVKAGAWHPPDGNGPVISVLEVSLGEDSVDGLADVTYWGGHAEEARAAFEGHVVERPGARTVGWTCRSRGPRCWRNHSQPG